MSQDNNMPDSARVDEALVDKPGSTTESPGSVTSGSSIKAQTDKKITKGVPMPMLLIGAAVLGVLAVMLLMPKKQSVTQHKANKVQFVPTFDTQGQSSDIEMKLAAKQAQSEASLQTELTHLKEQVGNMQSEIDNAKQNQSSSQSAFPAKTFTPIVSDNDKSLLKGHTQNTYNEQAHNNHNGVDTASGWSAPHGMTPMSGATQLSGKSLMIAGANGIMPEMQVFAVDYASATPADPYKDYVPAATIVRAVVVTGADANAGVGSQGDTVPMLFRLLDNGTEANDVKANLKGCFITGQTYGDISSDRGHVRLDRLACNHKDGTKLDIPVYGAAFGNGIEGIWGQEADRVGPVLWRSGISRLMEGFAKGLQDAQTTQNQSVLGTTTSVSPASSLKYALAGGGSKALGDLSSYYIQLANQYHPIIQLSAGTVVYIVFTRGFSTDVTQTVTVPTPIKTSQSQTNPYGFASAPQTQSWQQPDTDQGLSLPATAAHD